MKRIIRRTVEACAALFLLAGLPAATPPMPQPLGVDISKLEALPCPQLFGAILAPLGLQQPRTSYCGYLPRTEREDGTGRPIKLALAIIGPAKPANDVPVVYLHGGPGGDVVRYVEEFTDFPLADSRTLILLDQRGWGLTTPHLCDNVGRVFNELLLQDISKEDAKAREAKAYDDCLRELKQQGADLAEYGTEPTVRDLEAIRKALGLKTWNVYGGSYGTTVALAYMSAHPESLRAAILDANAPPERDDYVNIFSDFLRADERVLELCAADTACNERFPDLENALLDAIETLNREPVDTMTSPLSLNVRLKLDGSSFLGGIHLLHYDSNSIGMIPLLIDAARHRNAEMLSIIASLTYNASEAVGVGANLVISCREFRGGDEVTKKRDSTAPAVIAEAFGFEIFDSFCSKWPSRIDQVWSTPADTTVPTLVLSGRLDPITPPENGRFVVERLGAKAQFVEFPFLAHGSVSFHPCVDEIAQHFLAEPNAQVATTCVQEMEPPHFETEIVPVWGSWNVAAWYTPAGLTDALRIVGLVSVILLSVVLWPAIWFVRVLVNRAPNLETPFLLRSAVPMWAAIGLIIGWFIAIIVGIWSAFEAQSPVILIGLPARNWPGIWMLIVSSALVGFSLLALTRESWLKRIGIVGTGHRLVVIAALTAALAFLLSGLLIPLDLF